MKTKRTFLSIMLLHVALTIGAQNYDFGFVRDFSVPVRDSNLTVLGMPWAGGLNACHFNEIDLNLDGIKDLVVFDKAGDRILPFINNGTPGSIDYTYAPRYRYFFPAVTGWLQLKDYNCDGKEDLFAYAVGGIQVWKNVSDTVLRFQLVTPLLNSFQGFGYSNIPLTYVDYPVIADIDGDGDLDILAFFGLGSFLNMHKNKSMELYGNCDTLLFERTFNCWGNFAENDFDNTINLNIVCPWKCQEALPAYPYLEQPPSGGKVKHVGSTMLMLDMNNNGVQDLVLGDSDFMNLILLMNGGTADSAHIVSVDTSFPSNSVPVNLVSMPVPSYVDVNNDGVKDLLVSPFEPNLIIPESYKSVWYYENTGASNQPVFTFRADDFLQSDMIDVGSGAYPVFFDQDGDGLMDMIVANYGNLDSNYYEFGILRSVFRSRLALYRNTGTASNPEFTLLTRDYAGISDLGLLAVYPAFGDMDGDGDIDMICGASDGKLYYFENTAGPGNPANFVLSQAEYQGIDAGEYSAPVLVDLEGNGLLDLVIGNRSGRLSYYKNTGSANTPVFSFITDSLGKVNVTDYTLSYSGFSTPVFYRDSTGLLKLFVGSEQGRIYYFKDIEANLAGKFTAVDSVLIYIDEESETRFIWEGVRSGLAICDLDDDGYPDLIAGNFSGGLHYFKGTTPQPFSSVEQAAHKPEAGFSVFPNPAANRIWVSANGIPQGRPLVFEMYDLSGRLAMSKKFAYEAAESFDVSFIPPGIYLYSLTAMPAVGADYIRQSGKIVIVR
jgi:hypothetical protein